MYAIKEIFFTLQGEGFHSGRAAIFCRFSGCNLWNGLEKDRQKAICQFCDTNFWGTDGDHGGKYNLEQIIQQLNALWPEGMSHKFIVCTGGEPALQIDQILIDALHEHNFDIAIETNGTLPLPKKIDWVCVSPKAHTDILVQQGNELKLVYPQGNMDPANFNNWDFEHFYLQPMDNEHQKSNTEACLAYIKSNPKWKLSIQTHKILGIP